MACGILPLQRDEYGNLLRRSPSLVPGPGQVGVQDTVTETLGWKHYKWLSLVSLTCSTVASAVLGVEDRTELKTGRYGVLRMAVHAC